MLFLETNGFLNPESGAVDSLEQNPVLEVVDAVKKPAYLLHGKHCWQLPAHWSQRQPEAVIDFPAADMPIKVGEVGRINYEVYIG